jgi:hypothetical protein
MGQVTFNYAPDNDSNDYLGEAAAAQLTRARTDFFAGSFSEEDSVYIACPHGCEVGLVLAVSFDVGDEECVVTWSDSEICPNCEIEIDDEEHVAAQIEEACSESLAGRPLVALHG